MKLTLALMLLRFYPRTWRMRYEEEVRVLLEDCTPNWRDVAGLARGVATEHAYEFADPVAHPVVAGAVTGLGGWMVTTAFVNVTTVLTAAAVARFASAPEWLAPASPGAITIVLARGLVSSGFLADLRIGGGHLKPLSVGQARFWWAVLFVAVTVGHWTGSVQSVVGLPLWFGCVLVLHMSTESACRIRKARQVLRRLRQELTAALKEHASATHSVILGEATVNERKTAGDRINSLNAEIRIASAKLRSAGLRRLPSRQPLGLS